MNKELKEAIEIFEKLALGAMQHGLFKRFEDCNAVQRALQVMKAAIEKLPTERKQDE